MSILDDVAAAMDDAARISTEELSDTRVRVRRATVTGRASDRTPILTWADIATDLPVGYDELEHSAAQKIYGRETQVRAEMEVRGFTPAIRSDDGVEITGGLLGVGQRYYVRQAVPDRFGGTQACVLELAPAEESFGL
jgi:hypothetical protein